jgi:hypothetical protein
MAQKIESKYRVIYKDEEDSHLRDMRSMQPVYVENNSADYGDDLQKQIDNLNPGYKIRAELKSIDPSEGVQDGVWFYEKIEVTERTRFKFIESPDSIPEIFKDMKEESDSGFQDLCVRDVKHKNGQVIGFLSVGGAPDISKEIV